MRVTTKGQVTIPQEIRLKYAITSDSEVMFVEEGGKVVLKVLPQEESRAGTLRGKGDVKLSTEEILALTRGE